MPCAIEERCAVVSESSLRRTMISRQRPKEAFRPRPRVSTGSPIQPDGRIRIATRLTALVIPHPKIQPLWEARRPARVGITKLLTHPRICIAVTHWAAADSSIPRLCSTLGNHEIEE